MDCAVHSIDYISTEYEIEPWSELGLRSTQYRLDISAKYKIEPRSELRLPRRERSDMNIFPQATDPPDMNI